MTNYPDPIDTIIIGAGAAGLMCGISAASRGKQVLILDHANKVGKKILLSGGGRCNFTNLYAEPANYLSANPHFCKSALKRYTQWDFQALMHEYGLAFHEKKLGQLFCDNSAKELLNILLQEAQRHQVSIKTRCKITEITATNPGQSTGFTVSTSEGRFTANSLVIATGGLSFPTMGATGFGYDIARQFGHSITACEPALVPFTLPERQQKRFAELAGISCDVIASCNGQSFRENLLFTHVGFSGPAILQVSSYWQMGQPIQINWLPDLDILEWLKTLRAERPRNELKTVLAEQLSKRLADLFCQHWLENKGHTPLQQFSNAQLEQIANTLGSWQTHPTGTEGYRKAEVTRGGVNTQDVSSKTFESKLQPGLYFIGEVLDVTGHLGGFNFQWAWASGHCAGQAV